MTRVGQISPSWTFEDAHERDIVVSESHWSVLALARFLLALIVVNSHYFWMIYPALTSHPASDLGNALGPGVSVLGFLVISGFSIAHSVERSTTGFYGRRFARIWPTLAFACISYFFTGKANDVLVADVWPSVFPAFDQSYYGYGGLIFMLSNVFLINGFLTSSFLMTTWSLSIEAAYYVATPIFRSVPIWVTIGMTIVSSLLYWNHGLVTGDKQYPNVTNGLSAVSLFWAWGCGFLSYRCASWARGVTIVLGSCLITRWNDQGGAYWAVTWALACSAVGLGGECKLTYRSRALMNYLGDLSYPLFLIHWPIMTFLRYGLRVNTYPILLISALIGSALVLHGVDRPLRGRLGRLRVFQGDIERYAPVLTAIIVLGCIIGAYRH